MPAFRQRQRQIAQVLGGGYQIGMKSLIEQQDLQARAGAIMAGRNRVRQ
jgi:hypothetical protein